MWIGPFLATTRGMPAQDDARCNHAIPPPASARNLETSAARIARSTQSRQGLEVTLHKTATSRRNTKKLNILERRTAADQQQQVQQPQKDQAEQTQPHKTRPRPDS